MSHNPYQLKDITEEIGKLEEKRATIANNLLIEG